MTNNKLLTTYDVSERLALPESMYLYLLGLNSPIGEMTRLVMTDLVTVIPISHIVRWLITKLAARTASRNYFQVNHPTNGGFTYAR